MLVYASSVVTAASPPRYTHTTYMGTVHLHLASTHRLWPEWVNFLLMALILLTLLAMAVWMVRGITRRMRRA